MSPTRRPVGRYASRSGATTRKARSNIRSKSCPASSIASQRCRRTKLGQNEKGKKKKLRRKTLLINLIRDSHCYLLPPLVFLLPFYSFPMSHDTIYIRLTTKRFFQRGTGYRTCRMNSPHHGQSYRSHPLRSGRRFPACGTETFHIYHSYQQRGCNRPNEHCHRNTRPTDGKTF